LNQIKNKEHIKKLTRAQKTLSLLGLVSSIGFRDRRKGGGGGIKVGGSVVLFTLFT
jgi:hypothetical protein